MKCEKCGGDYKYIENFSADAIYTIEEVDGNLIKVQHLSDVNQNTHGSYLECGNCGNAKSTVGLDIDFI